MTSNYTDADDNNIISEIPSIMGELDGADLEDEDYLPQTD